MSKVVEPKVVEWTRLGREEIVPSNQKAFLMYKLFLLSQNIYVIYRSDITFVLGWGWALAQGLPFTGDHQSISGGSHDKGYGGKGCGMDKTRKERNCPRQEKSLSYVYFLLSQNIHVIYRSDITFVLGWGWALAQGFPSSFVLAGDYDDGSMGATHGKGSSSKGCGMDKIGKGRNYPRQEKSLSYVYFLLSQNIHVIYRSDITFVLGAKALPPKVVRWARLGREAIVPDKRKAFLCINCFCFPKTYM